MRIVDSHKKEETDLATELMHRVDAQSWFTENEETYLATKLMHRVDAQMCWANELIYRVDSVLGQNLFTELTTIVD